MKGESLARKAFALPNVKEDCSKLLSSPTAGKPGLDEIFFGKNGPVHIPSKHLF
jgi:hypothetical protein